MPSCCSQYHKRAPRLFNSFKHILGERSLGEAQVSCAREREGQMGRHIQIVSAIEKWHTAKELALKMDNMADELKQ